MQSHSEDNRPLPDAIPMASMLAAPNAIDRYLASRLQQITAAARVRIELWDGSSDYPSPPLGTLVVRNRATLVGLLLHPDRQFGESYTTRQLDVIGPLAPVVEALTRLTPPVPTWSDWLRSVLTASTSIASARRNIHEHYDLGNTFYAQWLDREMLYSCAYFPQRDAPLDAAQEAKMAHVCRKLQLRRDDLVIEAGCGWGALALYMAREHGARVRAFNVSREQLSYARERARREGLSHRVEFVDDDYRNVRGHCDAFVSVGMLEHVGLRQFHALAKVLAQTVRRRGGRGLLHFIGRDAPHPVNAWIRRHIFPGSYTPTLAEVTTRVLTPAGMSVVDVENLRLHYALTLRHWSERFAAVRHRAVTEYGDPFARAWELYLAGSQAAFATGWMQLFQVVFAPFESAPPYWSRQQVYTSEIGATTEVICADL
jgi:cyclopropane-fatty-acyl-phospholipid synthase